MNVFYYCLNDNEYCHERDGEKSGLVFAPGIRDTIEYAIFLEGQCQETTEF